MGSYISIVNNTQEDWMCKLSYDPLALKVGILIGAAVAAIAVIIFTAGSTTPLVTAGLGITGTVVLGVPATTLVGIGAVAGALHVVHRASKFSLYISNGVVDQLIREGFQLIPAGSKQSWKRSLSLWQQGTCMQVGVMDERTVMTRTLIMRPIFSGPSIDSNLDHEIQRWIDKEGTKVDYIHADTKTDVPRGATIFGNTSMANTNPQSFLVAVERESADAAPVATVASFDA